MERGKPIIVGIDPEYSRRADVEIQLQLRRPEITPVYSIADLAGSIQSFFASR